MSLYINDTRMAGNLGADARKHVFEDGNVEFSFRVASSKKFKRGEQEVEKTLWLKVKTRVPKDLERRIAYYERTLKKGNSVYVAGELETETWAKDGVEHSEHVLVCANPQIVNDRAAEPKPSAPAANDAPAPAPTPSTPAAAAATGGRQVLVPGGAF